MEEDHQSEPWESLDVDDSDIPFLRSCKRHNQNPSLLLSPSQSQSQSQPQTQPQPQNSHSQPQPQPRPQPQPQPQQPNPPPPSPQLIPGPAGAVQAAMRRRARTDRSSFAGAFDEEDSIPTQEYIRKVLENGDVLADDDFAANPWLSALDFVRREGNSAIPGTPLSSIKNGSHTDRVARVVAIIKSCTPNGLGDLMVTLKDPSGTMGASIHRKVLSDDKFGKIISIGAVLVLQKVAVFSPSRSTYYLNITLGNVVKVMSKDSGPPLKTNYTSSSVRYAAEPSESDKVPSMPQITISQERTKGIMSNLRKRSELRESVLGNRAMEDNKVRQSTWFSDENCRIPIASTGKESPFIKQVLANGTTKIAVTENTTCNDQVTVTDEQPNLWIPAEGDNSSHSMQTVNAKQNLVEVPADQETEIASGTKTQTQLLVSRSSPPEWTDEQLEELFCI